MRKSEQEIISILDNLIEKDKEHILQEANNYDFLTEYLEKCFISMKDYLIFFSDGTKIEDMTDEDFSNDNGSGIGQIIASDRYFMPIKEYFNPNKEDYDINDTTIYPKR